MSTVAIYSGFKNKDQESTYNKFVFKLIQILSEEIFTRRRNFVPGKSNTHNFNIQYLITDNMSNIESNFGDGLEKKVIKICKAMRIME
jgi:hypothetical protein